MTEDFALIDFALSPRLPDEICVAIGRAQAAREAEEAARSAAGKGFLSRMFRAGGRQPPADRLYLQPNGTLDPDPLTRPMLAEAGETGFGVKSPVRLSSPIGAGGMTLIEFREGDDDTSAFCESLSAELRREDLFYFRYSGSHHPGAHFAFHVYRDGKATRRAVSMSRHGTAPELDWTGVDDGMPHPVETESLPAPGTPAFDIMTPVRQASILDSLGIDPGELFEMAREAVLQLELTPHPGGSPLSEAKALVAHLNRRPPVMTALKGGRNGNGASAPAEPEPVAAPPEVAAVEPTPAPAPVPPPPPAATQPRRKSTTGPIAAVAPWDAQKPAPSWEEEVTAILLQAVEAGLPGGDQVGWLERLTGLLETGDLDTALSEARAMIDAGDRPEAEKQAVAKRLANLFGRAG